MGRPLSKERYCEEAGCLCAGVVGGISGHRLDSIATFRSLPAQNGLQRAFKIAEAKYLIMSLWLVDDLATQELMSEFYRLWLEKQMPIPDAFWQAQANMQARYVNEPYSGRGSCW